MTVLSTPLRVADGSIRLGDKLGAGCFGEVYRGFHTGVQKDVAVKFELASCVSLEYSPLLHEIRILEALCQPEQPQCIPKALLHNSEGMHFLVMELLGRTLEASLQACGGRFQVKTAVRVAQQMVCCIEYLHSKGVLHRDVKPENFMWGTGKKQHHLHIIDFGLSKPYVQGKQHIPLRVTGFTGSARYASINAHQRMEQSRRDDLEAAGYVLMFLLLGSLPWSGLRARSKDEKTQLICAKKIGVSAQELCRGFPSAFEHHVEYARGLSFQERPDYAQILEGYSQARADLAEPGSSPTEDHDFEWNTGQDLGPLLPLEMQSGNLEQPDQQKSGPSHSCLSFLDGFCTTF